MCGRYAIDRDPATLATEFDAIDRTGDSAGPDYNVTPTKTVPIVVQRGTERSIRPVRWGLVPTWASDPDSGPPMINARSESITTKPAYADAVARRRCLIPATGWYEWAPATSARRGKQPYFARRSDGASLAMAAVFSAWWPDDAGPDTTPVVSTAVVTTEATSGFAEVHHRMPLVLPRAAWSSWLDPDRTDVENLLISAPPNEELTMHPVSPAVNSVRNNSAELMRPVVTESEPEQAELALFGAVEQR